MSLVLRHQPEVIALTLDPGGWALIEDLVRLSAASRCPLTKELVLEVVRTSDKQRFRVSEDGSRIRCSQGHSIEVELALPAAVPPDILFHGTATRFVPAILTEGLLPGARQHVHLSSDRLTAVKVGARHGTALVFTVAAKQMYQAGRKFMVSDNGVWLTAAVPPQFLSTPADGA